VILLSLGVCAAAQQSTAGGARTEGGDYTSRVESIEAAQAEKARQTAPEVVSATERSLIDFKQSRLLEKLTYGIAGLRGRIGGLATGSGFGLGPEYYRDDLFNGQMRFRGTVQFSTHLYQLYDAALSLPKLANEHLVVDFRATHRNYPQMQYYGPGPHSQKTGRSDYRLEDTTLRGSLGVRPFRHLRMGVSGGFLGVNIGPGTHRRYVSSEVIYSPAQAPGIDHQTDFLQGIVFAVFDSRDNPGGPRSGGLYSATYTYNKDIDLHLNTHKRLDLEAQQYIPLFNQRRVIALRGRSEMTFPNANQVVPFYLQPRLGGSDDLRGFRPFRFYGDNLILLNAEYRYEIFAGLDMAVFGDAGKVFQRRADWNEGSLEASYGIGMRFNIRNSVFMRIDAGFSREGFQVWVKFNNVF
jgi:outer membrane protein assembly factor BamA